MLVGSVGPNGGVPAHSPQILAHDILGDSSMKILMPRARIARSSQLTEDRDEIREEVDRKDQVAEHQARDDQLKQQTHAVIKKQVPRQFAFMT